MLHHNTEGGLFSGYEDAGARSEEDDSADLYSVLGTLEDFRGDNGKLHFKLCYPEVKWAKTAARCNEWRQRSNPYTHTEIRGFEPVGKLAFPHQSECRPWKVGTETLLQCRYPQLLCSGSRPGHRGGAGGVCYQRLPQCRGSAAALSHRGPALLAAQALHRRAQEVP